MKLSCTHFTFVAIALFSAILGGVNALPILNNSFIISGRQPLRKPQAIALDGTQYRIELLPEEDQGAFSKTYNILDGGFKDKTVGSGGTTAAILKVVLAPEGSEVFTQTESEIRFLSKVGLLLHSEHSMSKTHYYLVMRNVRKGFPKQGDTIYKPAYEWYLEDKSLRGEKMMRTLKESLYERLRRFATEDGLLYYDAHLQNVFFDAKFKNAMPIDWGAIGRGVVEVTKDEEGKEHLAEFLENLKADLEEMDIEELERFLEEHGKNLRPNDRPSEK